MSFETFETIAKYFKNVNLVHLQGWGEPLLHERIFEMIEIAKQTSEVSITTNGMLLNTETCDRLLKLEIDYVAISVAGATPSIHENIRRKTVFAKLIENTHRLIKKRKDKPKVIFTFLMNSKNIQDLPSLVDLGSRVGVDEIIATNLDYIFDEITDNLKVFSCDRVDSRYRDILKKALMVARKRNIRFSARPLTLEEVPECDARPTDSLVISAEGDLYPCVYLSLPFERIPRIFCGNYVEVGKPYFGNVSDFWKSWNSKYYAEFRRIFERRARAYTQILEEAFLGQSPSSIRDKIRKAYAENPLPELCKTCYKAYGI